MFSFIAGRISGSLHMLNNSFNSLRRDAILRSRSLLLLSSDKRAYITEISLLRFIAQVSSRDCCFLLVFDLGMSVVEVNRAGIEPNFKVLYSNSDMRAALFILARWSLNGAGAHISCAHQGAQRYALAPFMPPGRVVRG